MNSVPPVAVVEAVAKPASGPKPVKAAPEAAESFQKQYEGESQKTVRAEAAHAAPRPKAGAPVSKTGEPEAGKADTGTQAPTDAGPPIPLVTMPTMPVATPSATEERSETTSMADVGMVDVESGTGSVLTVAAAPETADLAESETSLPAPPLTPDRALREPVAGSPPLPRAGAEQSLGPIPVSTTPREPAEMPVPAAPPPAAPALLPETGGTVTADGEPEIPRLAEPAKAGSPTATAPANPQPAQPQPAQFHTPREVLQDRRRDDPLPAEPVPTAAAPDPASSVSRPAQLVTVHDPAQVAITLRARADGTISDQDYRRLTAAEDNIDPVLLPPDHPRAIQTHHTVAAPQSGAQTLPQQVIGQLTTAVRQNGPGQTEVALNPPELGKVRIHIDSRDGAMVVHIHSDRPETMDLIRRHVDQLERQFQQLGYDTASFSFSSRGEQGGKALPQDDNPGSVALDTLAATETGRPRPVSGAGTVDIRL